MYFCPFTKYLKWQKYINGEYVDINIHKPKYKGSTYDLRNPSLVIHNLEEEDEVEYRLEIFTKAGKAYSNVFSLKLERVSGEIRIYLVQRYLYNIYS